MSCFVDFPDAKLTYNISEPKSIIHLFIHEVIHVCDPTHFVPQKQKAAQQREERQQQMKLQRQSKKEKRSGLFKKEQKLSIVVSVSREEDEDVDILSW